MFLIRLMIIKMGLQNWFYVYRLTNGLSSGQLTHEYLHFTSLSPFVEERPNLVTDEVSKADLI